MMRTLVIQAGGESRRMGQNKALMPFCGRPLIERVLQRTVGLAEQVLITANSPGQLEYLGLPIVADVFPGKGALGGLYTALVIAKTLEVVVVACDMPFVNSKLLYAECELFNDSQSDAVVPNSPHGLEPFHAVYRRERCLPAVRNAIENGQMRLTSWFSEVQMREMTLAEVAIFDPEYHAFINVNNREEYQKAEDLARQIG